MPDEKDTIHAAIVAAIVEHLQHESPEEGMAGRRGCLAGWKMAGRYERLGIGPSGIPHRGKPGFEIHR